MRLFPHSISSVFNFDVTHTKPGNRIEFPTRQGTALCPEHSITSVSCLRARGGSRYVAGSAGARC
jgi:hypothetical protein